MVSVVYPLLAEPALQFQGDGSLEHPSVFVLPMPEGFCLRQFVETFETGIYKAVPDIIQSPVLFQPVGNPAGTGYDEL